jgi:hypothetical protein
LTSVQIYTDFASKGHKIRYIFLAFMHHYPWNCVYGSLKVAFLASFKEIAALNQGKLHEEIAALNGTSPQTHHIRTDQFYESGVND